MTARSKILVVDDERLLAEVIAEYLSDQYDVQLASTAARAIARLGDADFDAVLCDVQLPDGTALDVYRAYTQAWPARAGRFVFVTGGSSDPTVRAMCDAGARLLRKPFDVDALPPLLDAILRG